MWSTLLLISAAQAIELDFECSAEGGFVVGVPPLEVQCVLEEPTVGTWTNVVWLMGDGVVGEGPDVVHTYEEAGLYSVSAFLEGYVDPSDPFADDTPGTRRDSLVSVCGAPSPSFTYVDKGGRSYQMVNLTDVSAPRCIDEIEWRVFSGSDRQGAPVAVQDGWEPRLELDEDGTYTVELTVSGIGGVSTAVTGLEAKYGLTEELRQNYANSCSSTGALGVGMLPLMGAFLVARRRRRVRQGR